MASASTASSADAKKDKPSFAKIAAAGIKPPNVQQHAPTSSNPIQQHDVPSPPPDGAPIVAPSNGSSQPAGGPKHKTLVQLASKDMKHTKEPVEMGPNGPEFRVQIVESVPQRPREPAPEGSLMPSSDDVGTQVSSSSGSNKPQSLDGKSDVASGTTFALDEKDSLRPDDSASVKAVEEDDMFSPPGSGLPGSRIGSDDGVRAFRDQLREISSMEPQRRGPPPIYGQPPKGVLYVPPQGPGIGSVPNAHRTVPPVPEPITECTPDQKLLDALENPRDRVWVLKLEQDVIDFVKDPKESSLTLPQCHSFYRLLAHKMADYYMLGHLVDDTSAAVRLYKTPDCRIPPPLTGITQPSTAASTPPPSAQPMKILKRGVDRSGPAIANGSNMPSKSGSENGDSGDDKKKPVTREEREARYEAARLRIMGSAKPTESPDATKDKQESRPNSTSGKKSKKKARADSDDGFDPRSAYSNFYTPSYGSDGVATPSYAYQGYTEGASNQFPSAYAQTSNAGSLSQMQMQPGSGTSTWNQHSYQQVDPTQAWAHGQSSGYDLSAEFQRTMTFQNQVPAQNQAVGYNASYGSQYNYGGQQQGWSQQQQQYQMQPQVSQAGYGYGSNYTSTANQMQQDQPYAFGQLPSQAFPGRPPSKTEHPLPGSYKSKHFNPQSQTFIPGQTNSSPFSPHAVPANHGYTQGYGSGSTHQPPQRQSSTQSQSSTFGSSHHNSPNMMHNRMHTTPLTHPLPQGPVFPRHPSPNVPLPPKPGTNPQRPNEYTPIPQPVSSAPPQQNQSLLAKWGAPASLPAKPPPSAEPFDAVKLKQIQQQSFANSPAVTARHPPGIPAFGTMPQNGAGQIVNGSGTAKRA